jgi:hypothetical protein
MTTILENPYVLQAMFHPRRDDFAIIRPGAFLISLAVAPEVSVGGRLYPTADPNAPLILYYHGNGEIAADYDNIEELYTRMGISLLVMDYRGYGTSSGSPQADNLVQDAQSIYAGLPQLLLDYHLSPTSIYVMGRSLGSVPAIETALHFGQQLGGLIIESGFSDTFGLLQRLGVQVEGANEERDGFGNAQKMERITTPTLVIHGEDDYLIPPKDGAELFIHCAATDKTLELIPGAGHNDIMITGMRRYFSAIGSFVLQAK